ncbi:MAG: hypothetical protein ACE5HK_01760 [Candidatus Methylomirabilales bacterium]
MLGETLSISPETQLVVFLLGIQLLMALWVVARRLHPGAFLDAPHDWTARVGVLFCVVALPALFALVGRWEVIGDLGLLFWLPALGTGFVLALDLFADRVWTRRR